MDSDKERPTNERRADRVVDKTPHIGCQGEWSMVLFESIGSATIMRDRLSWAANLEFVDRINVLPSGSSGLDVRQERSARDSAWDIPDARPQGLARMAEAAGRLKGQRAAILYQLLHATSAPPQNEGSPLRPIWAFENFARAKVMIRLLSSLDRLRKNGSPHMLSLEVERDTAARLSTGLGLLQDLSSVHPVPCSGLLRHVVRDLVELFGPTIGEVSVATRIEPITMTGIRRRAVVLAVCNLVLNSIADGFPGRSRGALLVSLQRINRAQVRLTVADNGCASDRDYTEESWEAVDDLVAILGGRLFRQRDGFGGAITELTLSM
jgi:two-component sensor histidine kinase